MADDTPTFDATIERIERRLHDDALPGPIAQLSMAPGYRADINLVTIDRKKCMEASVLALLVPDEGGSLVLTVRRPTLKHHGGQISLPGGRRDAGESLVETALRECHEEIGVTPADVTVLGTLTPLYIPVTRFCVHPFVGATTKTLPDLSLGEDEVERIIALPLTLLATQDIRATHRRAFAEKVYEVPHYAVNGEIVWGATAMIIAEFAELLAER